MHTVENAKREALFRTSIFSHQLVAYCSSCGRTREEIRKFFSDISTSTVRRTLNKQLKLGTLMQDGGIYKATGKPLEGDLADRLWKAARLLEDFTTADLELYTGASLTTIRDLLRQWSANGYVKVIGGGGGKLRIYRMDDNAPLARPIGNNRPGRRG